jgi:hypothetical protein
MATPYFEVMANGNVLLPEDLRCIIAKYSSHGRVYYLDAPYCILYG